MFNSSKIWTLNRETLLQRVSMGEILSYYIPGKGSKYKVLCHFHKDSRPSMHVNLHKGIFKCYSCGTGGDGFEYIMKKYNVNFIESQKIIANDFGLLEVNYDRKPSPELLGIEKQEKSCEIQIKTRKWTKRDIQYWEQFNISLELCKLFEIYPISHYWLGDRVFEAKNELIFAYRIESRFKIYKPFAIQFKWFSSLKKDDIFGFNQLDYSSDILVITKSLKDVACLRSFGIAAIAPQAESILLSYEIMQFLYSKFEKIYTLFDYDNSGIHLSWKMRKLYNTKPLFLTDKLWNRKGGYKGCKDISEFTFSYKSEVKSLINQYL